MGGSDHLVLEAARETPELLACSIKAHVMHAAA
jgi:hypothetical protein